MNVLTVWMPPALTPGMMAMRRDDNAFPLCFYTPAPFALFRPRTGRERESQSHHLALSGEREREMEREKRGNRSLLLSYLSLNKKPLMKTTSILSLSRSLSLSVICLLLASV